MITIYEGNNPLDIVLKPILNAWDVSVSVRDYYTMATIHGAIVTIPDVGSEIAVGGYCYFSAVPEGTYPVTTEATGYLSKTMVLELYEPKAISFMLKPVVAAEGVPEGVPPVTPIPTELTSVFVVNVAYYRFYVAPRPTFTVELVKNPIPNALVSIDSTSGYTDNSGNITFNLASLEFNQYKTYEIFCQFRDWVVDSITYTKDGEQFDGSKVIVLNNQTVYVAVVMKPPKYRSW